MNINLGCGDHVIPGWLNLDNREISGAKLWEFGSPIPVSDLSADFVMISYALMYCERVQYRPILAEALRTVMRGGWLIIREDDDRKRVWRKVGRVLPTGQIRSTSTAADVIEVLYSISSLLDVVLGYPVDATHLLDSTHRGAAAKSYIVSARKP